MFVLRCAAAWGPSGGLDHTLIRLMGGVIAAHDGGPFVLYVSLLHRVKVKFQVKFKVKSKVKSKMKFKLNVN